MTLGLTGEVVLVTGGSRGIGRAIVEVLAQRGCRVAFCYRSDIQAAQELCAAITAQQGEVRALNWMVNPVPGYVERDLRKFLECGILAHGFARARCEQCGQDFLVAYSCKGRGMCPGCNTRRMVETAAHGGACISSSGRTVVGGGISEARTLLFRP